MARRVIGIVMVVVGVAAIVGSFVWDEVAVDRLVKYPTDVDESPEYEGTVTLYLDPATYTPIPDGRAFPLAVTRNIRALGDESTSDLVVVDEGIELAAEGLFAGTLDAQYVMDRKDIVNVADPRSWAFTADNVVDRAGAYRLAFPFDTQSVPYTVYKNEIESTYVAQPRGEGQVEGLDVLRFGVDTQGPFPVAPAYLAQLQQLNPLPDQLTLDELKPILLSVGLDIDALLPQLATGLEPADVQTLLGLAEQPIPLEYVYTFSGEDAVEPSTGQIVEVKDVVETLWVQPEPSTLPRLQAIFDKYPDVPAAVEASEGLGRVAAAPIKVFENSFSQTPASVADIADTVRDAKDDKRLAEDVIPTGLLIAGTILTVIGLALVFWPRHREPAPATPAPGPGTAPAPALSPEPASVTAPPAASVEARGEVGGEPPTA